MLNYTVLEIVHKMATYRRNGLNHSIGTNTNNFVLTTDSSSTFLTDMFVKNLHLFL